MPARTGAQYLAGLRQRDTEVWLRGERVRDVTTHPGLAGGAQAIASLYDLQCDPGQQQAMTFACPDTGDTLGQITLYDPSGAAVDNEESIRVHHHERFIAISGQDVS